MAFLGMLIGIEEMILIGLAGLLIFGTSQLPNIGKTLGKAISDIRESAGGVLDDSGLPEDGDPEDPDPENSLEAPDEG